MTKVFLDARVKQVLEVDQFMRPCSTTDLGLISDVANPISKTAKLGATLIQVVYEVTGHETDTTGFTDIDEIPLESAQSKLLTFADAASTFQTQLSPPTKAHKIFTSRLIPSVMIWCPNYFY